MSDLRTRIAVALEAEGAPMGESEMWADAVILALGLKRASRPSDYGPVNYPPGYQYITDWIADE